MRKLKFCLFILPLILLLSGCGVDHSGISNNAVSGHTDVSVSYLAMIFGDVGTVLHGLSGQMLGMLFYKFNEGVLCVAGLWLVYTVTTFSLQAAEGTTSEPR